MSIMSAKLHVCKWWISLQANVGVSKNLKGKVQGLCGNYDGSQSNDNLKKDGTPGSPAEVGNSFQVHEYVFG